MRSLCIWLIADTPQTLHGFSDVDWVGNPDDRTSTGAFFIFLSSNPIFLSSAKQLTIARSSTEAEYSTIMVVVAELQCVKSLMSELLVSMQSPPTLFSDNLGATYLSANLVFHFRMKHLAIDYHFVHDLVQLFELHVVHVSDGD